MLLGADCKQDAKTYGQKSSDASWFAVFLTSFATLVTSLIGIATSYLVAILPALQTSVGATMLAATGATALTTSAAAAAVAAAAPVGALAVGTIFGVWVCNGIAKVISDQN